MSQRHSIRFRSDVRGGQWYQFLHLPGSACKVLPHEVGLCHTLGGSPGPTAPVYGLIVGPRISPRYLMAVRMPLAESVEVSASLRGPSLNGDTGSITFSTASPGPFKSVTCLQGEAALICEKHRALVVDLPIMVFCGKCQSDYMVSGIFCDLETVLGDTANLAMACIDVLILSNRKKWSVASTCKTIPVLGLSHCSTSSGPVVNLINTKEPEFN